jgi:hypothetical protein
MPSGRTPVASGRQARLETLQNRTPSHVAGGGSAWEPNPWLAVQRATWFVVAATEL